MRNKNTTSKIRKNIHLLFSGLIIFFVFFIQACVIDIPQPADLTPPKILSVYPVSGETNAAKNSIVSVVFDDSMNLESFSPNGIPLVSVHLSNQTNTVPFSLTLGNNGKLLVITMNNTMLLTNTNYTVTLLDGFFNTDKIKWQEDVNYQWSFTVKDRLDVYELIKINTPTNLQIIGSLLTISGTIPDKINVNTIAFAFNNTNINPVWHSIALDTGQKNWNFSIDSTITADIIQSNTNTVYIRAESIGFYEFYTNIQIVIDNTPPTISVDSLVNGSVISNIATFTGIASDSFGIQEISYSINSNFSIMSGLNNWSNTLDTGNIIDGTYPLIFYAVDKAGNVTEKNIAVNVSNWSKHIVVNGADNHGTGFASWLSGSTVKTAYINNTSGLSTSEGIQITPETATYPRLYKDSGGTNHLIYIKSSDLWYANNSIGSYTNCLIDVAYNNGTAGGYSIQADNGGGIHIVYSRNQYGGGIVYKYFDGSSWHSNLIVNDGQPANGISAAVDNGGTNHIFYYEQTDGSSLDVFTYLYITASWSGGVLSSQALSGSTRGDYIYPNGAPNRSRISIDGNRTYMLFTVPDGSGGVRLYYSYFNGSSWENYSLATTTSQLKGMGICYGDNNGFVCYSIDGTLYYVKIPHGGSSVTRIISTDARIYNNRYFDIHFDAANKFLHLVFSSSDKTIYDYATKYY